MKREYAVVFKWQTNDSEKHVWCNGWVIRAHSPRQAVINGRTQLNQLAKSAINRTKLRLVYSVVDTVVETFPEGVQQSYETI